MIHGADNFERGYSCISTTLDGSIRKYWLLWQTLLRVGDSNKPTT